MTRKLILGDVHGNIDDFLAVLEEAGAIDSEGNKNPDVHVIQVGDFLNLGYGQKEADFYQKAYPLVDELLIGNHEFPAIGGPHFAGYENRDVDAMQMFLSDFHSPESKWKAATTVGNFLVSHAGIHPFYLAMHFGEEEENVDYIAARLNSMFTQAVATFDRPDLFYAVGRARGGAEEYGGLFWCDFEDLCESYDLEKDINQIIGHTPHNSPTQFKNLVCLDVAGGVGYIYTDNDGKHWVGGMVRTGDESYRVA